MSTSSSPAHIYQVSELNQKVRLLLEGEFVNIWISGEISNLIKASSGHWYFSLKDQKAQIKAAMFRQSNRRVNANIQEGSQVLVRGRISLYEPRGDYQFIVEFMEPAGEGLLKQQFEQLKHSLAAMGLFDQDVKRTIPKSPKRVGIITSPTGAAIHDMLTVLERRSPQTEVTIYPSMVQGDYAAQNLIWAINTANYRNEVDVLIIGRGGGSLEDLWSFNDEALAHTIYNSELPIISAVGHEVDVSISDFVADLRAPTPSAAAELVSTDNSELTTKITSLYSRLLQAYAGKLNQQKQQLSNLNNQLSLLHPNHKIQMAQQRCDELLFKLNSLNQQKITLCQQQLAQQKEAVLAFNPQLKLQQTVAKQQQLQQRLTSHMQTLLERNQHQWQQLSHSLHIVSPLATLDRGYAIVKDDNNKVITDSEQVKPNQNLNVKLHQGELKVTVQ